MIEEGAVRVADSVPSNAAIHYTCPVMQPYHTIPYRLGRRVPGVEPRPPEPSVTRHSE